MTIVCLDTHISKRKAVPTKYGYDFTPMQSRVLALVIQGKTTKEIARELDIGARTVESHRRNVMEKVGVNNVVALVYKIYEKRLAMGCEVCGAVRGASNGF